MAQCDSPWEPVYRSHERAACFERALVLRSVGIPYEVHATPGAFTLVVLAADSARARAELDAYAQENPVRPPPATIPQRGGGWGGVFGYAAVLLVVAVFEGKQLFGLDWLAAGRTHAGLIRDGQWWRTITALTLHADVSHLLGNTIIGGLFGLFAGQLLGSGLAWCSILASGALGNLINAFIRPATHTSIGASTAVFGSLGLVAAYAWVRRRDLHADRFTRWAPIVGGVVLLSYFGTSGVRTDVAAHVAGFLAGLLLGSVYGKLGDRMAPSRGVNFLLGLLTVVVVIMAWAVALTRQV